MLTNQYKELADQLTEAEQALVVKGLLGPIETKPATMSKLTILELATSGDGTFTLTELGELVATYLQVAQAIADDEEVDEGSSRWNITFEVIQPQFQRAALTFREALSIIEPVEARAVSYGHAVVRARYPNASRIRAVSRVKYELPRDMDAVEFINPNGV